MTFFINPVTSQQYQKSNKECILTIPKYNLFHLPTKQKSQSVDFKNQIRFDNPHPNPDFHTQMLMPAYFPSIKDLNNYLIMLHIELLLNTHFI